MKVLLTGGTGYAGSEVLRQLLDDSSIEEVVVLGRRPIGVTHQKLRDLVLENFLDYSTISDALEVDACIWCLGVSQTEVSREKYVEITFDYTLAAARAMWAQNPNLRFCFLSDGGADQEEKTSAFFGKIKGRTERELSKLNENAFNFRPGLIKPSRRGEKTPLGIKLFSPITWIVDRFTDGFSVETATLARCLIDVAKHGAEQKLFDNRAIRNWSGR